MYCHMLFGGDLQMVWKHAESTRFVALWCFHDCMVFSQLYWFSRVVFVLLGLFEFMMPMQSVSFVRATALRG